MSQAVPTNEQPSAAQASPAAAARSKIFISYSRKDKEFVRKLHAGLVANGLEVWVDWEGIPLSADWMAEITAAIEGADAFVFVISPDSLNSKVCGDELALGIQNHKKLVPVLHRVPEKGDPMPPQVGATNWVYLREQDDFEATMPKLVDAILTDLDWVKQHTRLIQRSVEWLKNEANPSFLLRGVDLNHAESWQTLSSAQTGRQITSLQAEYIQNSREDARRRQRILLTIVTITLIITALLAIYALIQRGIAIQQEQIALAQKGVAQAQWQQGKHNYQVSTLLAIESMQRHPSAEAEQVLRQNLSLLPAPLFQVDHDPASASDEVDGIVFSPDGKRLATTSYDGSARVWDAASGKELLRLQHDAEVTEIAFSPDGTRLATASADGTARVWDAQNGDELFSLAHEDQVLDIAFSPDGTRLATASADLTARVWDAATGEELFRLEHTDWATRLAFSPDGRTLAVAAEQTYLWDVSSGDLLTILPGDAAPLFVAFSPDGSRLLSGGQDRTAVIWDAATGEELARLAHNDWVEDGAFSPQAGEPAGGWVATASDDGAARLWNPESGAIFYLPHDDFVYCLQFSPDGHWLATCSRDGLARLWETATGHLAAVMSLESPVWQVAFDPSGWRLAAGSEDGRVAVWDVRALLGDPLLLPQPDLARALALSADGTQLAVASDDLSVRLFDAASGEERAALELPDYIFDLAFDPTGDRLAIADGDGSVYLWMLAMIDPADDTAPISLTHNTEWVRLRSVAFSPDGKLLAAGGEDGVIKVWDAASASDSSQAILALQAEDAVWALRFSADGKSLFSGSVNGSLARWDLPAGQLNQQTSAVKSIALPDAVADLDWSADGRWLAAAVADGKARLWPAEAWLAASDAKKLPAPVLLAQDDAINALAFSPDNQLLATAGSDLSLRLWTVTTADAASGQAVIASAEIGRIIEGRKINHLTFSPDGKQIFLAAGGLVKRYTTSQITRLPSASLISAACTRLTRNLTSDEWRQLIGDQEAYRLLCPDLKQ